MVLSGGKIQTFFRLHAYITIMNSMYIRKAFIFLLIPLFIGCSKTGITRIALSNIPADGSAGNNSGKKYLALGDSYTIGQGVPVSASFPLQTQNWLIDNGAPIDKPDIIAVTGWTCSDLMNAINNRNPATDYDVVSLLIGVNDQYSRQDTTGYRTGFTQLLVRAIQFAGNRSNRVFTISIPDYSVTPFAASSDTVFIRKQVDQFNLINKEVTAQYFCNYLDITPSSREAKNDPALIAPDGLHPSGKEYRKWGERLGAMMKAVL